MSSSSPAVIILRIVTSSWLHMLPLIVAASALAQAPADLLSQLQMDSAPLQNAGVVTLSYADAVQKSLPSVVTVLTVKHVNPDRSFRESRKIDPLDLIRKDKETPVEVEPQRGGGSGVILTRDGYIITNNHVVDDVDTITVRMQGRKQDVTARLVGRDPLTDIALLKIETGDLKPMTIADSTLLKLGDVVLALGSPFGLEQTVTLGIVSGTGRSMNFIKEGYEDFIQTDAPINPGNSGGALVDGTGRLVGINTAVYPGGWAPVNSIGFAVPVNLALRVAGDLLAHGHVRRGHLGVRWDEAGKEAAPLITGRQDVRPAEVMTIEAGSPADLAGFAAGDLILSLNGKPAGSLDRIRYGIATLAPGSKARIDVQRGKERVTLEAVLVEAPVPASEKKTGARLVGEATRAEESAILQEGLEVGLLTNTLRQENSIPASVAGALVTKALEDGRPMLKIPEGSIIIAVNGKAVRDTGEVKKHFDQASPGSALMLRIWRPEGERFARVLRK